MISSAARMCVGFYFLACLILQFCVCWSDGALLVYDITDAGEQMWCMLHRVSVSVSVTGNLSVKCEEDILYVVF